MVLNLPVFMLVYIHFNVPPTEITDLVRNSGALWQDSNSKIENYGFLAAVTLFEKV